MSDIAVYSNQAESSEGATQALAARQVEQVRAEMAVAKHFPRDEMRADNKLRESCERPMFADRALYSFPRGGATVSGPSVYLAREAARLWGNIQYGVDVLPSESDICHIEAWARDLETNARVTAQDRFKRRIQRKDKRTGKTEWVEPDERDMRELLNRRGALNVRNCILQLLPADMVDRAQAICELTMRQAAKGKLKENPKDEIRKLLKGFASFSVSQDMLERWLGHKVADMSPDQYAELVQIGTSLKDGNSKREDHFDVAGDAVADLNEELGKAMDVQATKRKEGERKPAPEAEAEPEAEVKEPESSASGPAGDGDLFEVIEEQ